MFLHRRRRHFQSQSLYELLDNEDIDTALLMPKNQPEGMANVKLNADPEDPAPFPPYLPLEIFDNAEFDQR